MVHFRFHLVSLVAVFLALALGIAVGATVVDRATVDLLQNRLTTVDNHAERTDQENAGLTAALRTWQQWTDEAGDRFADGRLPSVPVLVVAVRGVDRRPVERLRTTLQAAGARLQGTVWLTTKLRAADEGTVGALAESLGADQVDAAAARTLAVTRLAAAWTAPADDGPNAVSALKDAGFVELDPPPDPATGNPTAPDPQTRFVVVSASTATVPNEDLAVPLTAELARVAPARVVAVEPGHDATAGAPADRAAFVGLVRSSGDLSPGVSTVDNIEDWRGRLAAVLALSDLEAARFGHYGVGPRATRLLPPTASAS